MQLLLIYVDIESGSISDSARALIWSSSNANNQLFHIAPLADGQYSIVATHSSKALDVEAARLESGNSIIQYSQNGGSNQQWMFYRNAAGYVHIVSACDEEEPWAITATSLTPQNGAYLAFLSVEFGWLALPTADECVDERLMPVYAQGTNHAFFEGYDEIGLMSSGSNNGQKIEKFINWIEHTPVGMVLFSKALWTTWMAVFVLYESFRRKINIRNVLAFSPYIITYCLLWVSPVSIGVGGNALCGSSSFYASFRCWDDGAFSA